MREKKYRSRGEQQDKCKLKKDISLEGYNHSQKNRNERNRNQNSKKGVKEIVSSACLVLVCAYKAMMHRNIYPISNQKKLRRKKERIHKNNRQQAKLMRRENQIYTCMETYSVSGRGRTLRSR